MRILIFLFLLIFSFSVSYPQNVLPPLSNQIRLGSFNIEKLGRDTLYQIKNVAIILKNYDIVAIQEVMNTGATKTNPVGNRGIEALKKIVYELGEDWDYVVSPEANGTAGAMRAKAFDTFEYYAYIYRKSKIEFIKKSEYLWDEKLNPIKGVKNQERQFDREPFIASFKTKEGKLDFTLITIHVASPGSKNRRDEIKRLKIVYEKVQSSDTLQNDVFLLGDFNTPVDKKEWDALKSIETMKHIISNENGTTLNKQEGIISKNQYDNIWYQGKFSDEDIVPETGLVHQAWKEDINKPFLSQIHRKFKKGDKKLIWLYGKYVSDHLPVSILLWIDRDTDYFNEGSSPN